MSNPIFDARAIVIGTRTSDLALWQANTIKDKLESHWPGLACLLEPFITKGDKTLDKPLPEIGGKGLFTAELEAVLRDGRIDLAVHSLKDLPTEDAPGLTVGAICQRADVRDVLIAANGSSLGCLPAGQQFQSPDSRAKLQARPQSLRG